MSATKEWNKQKDALVAFGNAVETVVKARTESLRRSLLQKDQSKVVADSEKQPRYYTDGACIFDRQTPDRLGSDEPNLLADFFGDDAAARLCAGFLNSQEAEK